jgi:hypothetical protein
MLSPTVRTFRLTKMTGAHQTIQGVLSSTPQSIAQIATACAITLDDCERKLSALVDEILGSRTVGDRITARYTAL